MIRIKLVFLSFIFLSNNSFANCAINTDVLGAQYKITSSLPEKQTASVRHMALWRNSNQVAHQYSDTHITEVWEKMSNGKLRMVRNFDEHQRGIEYEPGEIKTSHNKSDWETKSQLISNGLIGTMQLISSTGNGCEKLEKYTLNKDGIEIRLQWLANKKLIKTYTVKSASAKVKWELQNIHSETSQVKKIFATRSNYYTTDYTDVGDNESDPFLMKMINLGFVAHGASGMYDQHGNALDSRHGH